jgi:hypothetical protein
MRCAAPRGTDGGRQLWPRDVPQSARDHVDVGDRGWAAIMDGAVLLLLLCRKGTRVRGVVVMMTGGCAESCTYVVCRKVWPAFVA